MHQVEGLDGIIEGGRTIVGHASGVGQSVWVNSRDQAILIMNVGGEFGILGMLTASVHLLATTAVAASLSLGRSISTATAVGSTLLLLLGKLRVCLLVLHSTKLVGLWGLATSATRGTLLLEQEHCHLYDSIGLQVPNLTRSSLTQDLSYDLHSRRELA